MCQRARLPRLGQILKMQPMSDAPYTIRPASSPTALLFVCDHAGNALPEGYGTLGLEPARLEEHIAYDIGASEATLVLADAYGAEAVLARYSRLFIDLNRGEDDPTLVMRLSDGRIIPGNAAADAAEIARRIAQVHRPYHTRVADSIARRITAGVVPVLVSVHSFTPTWKGRERPWQVGVLWDRDPRLARPFLAALAAHGFVAGDNEPYSGALHGDTMWRHGTMNGLPHVLVEMRQDLLATPEAARAFALSLKPALDAALAAMGPPEVRFFAADLNSEKGIPMDVTTQTEIEAAVFRRLVAHLQARSDVQNIDLMNLAGFCRNCLGDWYREAAAEKAITLAKDEARSVVYGMDPAEWKKRYQKDASVEALAKFAAGNTSGGKGH